MRKRATSTLIMVSMWDQDEMAEEQRDENERRAWAYILWTQEPKRRGAARRQVSDGYLRGWKDGREDLARELFGWEDEGDLIKFIEGWIESNIDGG